MNTLKMYTLALYLVVFPKLLQASPAPKLFPVTVQLDWTYDAQFAGLLLAKSQGFFRAAGLDVTILPVDGSMQTSKVVTSHSNWIGVAEADILIMDRAKGLPVKAFATMLQSTPFALITLKKSGIHSISQLKGKKIGLHGDGQKAIDVILGYNGLTRKEVQIIDVPYGLDPLINGQVDAMQGYMTDEAVQLELGHHPVNVIPMSENGYVSYAEVLFTSDHFLKSHPDVLSKFVKAAAAGWKYSKEHPDESAEILVNQFKAEGGVAAQLKELEKVQPILNSETHDDRLGWMEPNTWKESMEMFKKYQFLTQPVPLSDLVDYSILHLAYP